MAGKLTTDGCTLEGDTIHVPGRDIAKVNEIIDLLRQSGLEIESVEPQRFSLEDVFVEVLGSGSKAPPLARQVGG